MSSPERLPRDQDESRPCSLINRCNLPPWLISSEEFQANPEPIEIDGVRRTDHRLFDRLAKIDDPQERGRVFHDYISVKFGLHDWAAYEASARSSLRRTYVQFIHGWGADSNGRAGAVLKGWVESRFGLEATYHDGVLADSQAARERFAFDRMHGAAKTMGALMQLDLLYTFCQDELARRFPGERWKTLYRGTHDPEEYAVHDKASRGSSLVRLNNLSSFTSDPEVAWEFGSLAWEVKVPLSKTVFFSGLLPDYMLGGESEYLVLGGYYRVRTLLY
jgi:NAD+--dinitrogen-reductase ADP-D-ribosyltransferase